MALTAGQDVGTRRSSDGSDGCALTKASAVGSGYAAIGETLLAGEPEVVTVFADAACGSEELRAEPAVRGHVIGPNPRLSASPCWESASTIFSSTTPTAW